MVHLDQRAPSALRSFRELLDIEGYSDACGGSQLIRRLIRDSKPEILRVIWNNALTLSNRQRFLLGFLFFGIRTQRKAAEDLIGADVVSTLIGLDFLRVSDDRLEVGNYCLLPVNGHYLIAPRIFSFETVPKCPLYIGYDSFVLADVVRREADVHFAFEIGSGTGLATLIGPQSRTIAFDIDPNAVLISSANFSLNGVEDQCLAAEGDLFLTHGFELPDLIFSNPPYVPAPLDAPLPVYSWGGEDGLDVMRRILAAFQTATCGSTRGIFVLSAYGSSEETALKCLLTKVSSLYRVELRYNRRLLMEWADYEALAEGASTVSNGHIVPSRFQEHFEKLDFRYKYECIVKLDPDGPVGLKVFSDYSS
jgi:hypothetical protein